MQAGSAEALEWAHTYSIGAVLLSTVVSIPAVPAPAPADDRAVPTTSFADAGVPADLVELLAHRGITGAFPIQAATLPDALAGHDVSGCAPTGSGKTLAFGLALALRTGVAKARRPRSLVLVPTRELASQVQRELAPLAATRGLKVLAVYGGTSYVPQRKAIQDAAAIIVATPGRLEDLVSQGDIRLDDVDMVVIDEADRMADMGFLPAVRRLLDSTRSDRQTLLFSATLDGDVDALVKRYQRQPRRHDVVTAESATEDVEHLFWFSERSQRVSLTVDLVVRHERAIVFCRTRHGADRLTKQLAQAGVSAVAIHGDRSQAQRDRALAAFTSGSASALVATDVAARGIHVDGVPCVVHYDPPGSDKDYVHRSGRTGRAGATGVVVSLVGDEHRATTRALQRALGLPQGIDHRAASGGRASSGTPTDTPTGRRLAVVGPTRASRDESPRRNTNGPGVPKGGAARNGNGGPGGPAARNGSASRNRSRRRP